MEVDRIVCSVNPASNLRSTRVVPWRSPDNLEVNYYVDLQGDNLEVDRIVCIINPVSNLPAPSNR